MKKHGHSIKIISIEYVISYSMNLKEREENRCLFPPSLLSELQEAGVGCESESVCNLNPGVMPCAVLYTVFNK